MKRFATAQKVPIYSRIWDFDRRSLLVGNMRVSRVVSRAKYCWITVRTTRTPKTTNMVMVRPSFHAHSVPANVSAMTNVTMVAVLRRIPSQSIFERRERTLDVIAVAWRDGR